MHTYLHTNTHIVFLVSMTPLLASPPVPPVDQAQESMLKVTCNEDPASLGYLSIVVQGGSLFLGIAWI